MEQTILIIDDEPVAALTTAAVFQKSGYRVLRSSTAQRAIAAFESEPVDVVIMDDQLDDAPSLAQRLKRLRPSVPLLVFSSVPTNPDGASFADGYVAKPENPRRLLQRVATLLENTGNAAAERWDAGAPKAA